MSKRRAAKPPSEDFVEAFNTDDEDCEVRRAHTQRQRRALDNWRRNSSGSVVDGVASASRPPPAWQQLLPLMSAAWGGGWGGVAAFAAPALQPLRLQHAFAACVWP
jgi:hypothetical protein